MKRNSDEVIDKAFRSIDEQFDKISRSNADELGYSQLKPIDEKYPYAQNGITAMIAPVDSGKSYNYLKHMAKQEHTLNEPLN